MAEGPNRRGLVILAEDNEDVRRMLRVWLTGRGFDVAEASDGGEALTLCQQTPPDLILTDLQMPCVDGVTAIKYIRQDRRLQHVPIIAITAFGDMGIELFLNIEGMGEAPIEYVTKPISFAGLEEIINRVLPADPPPAARD